MEKPRIKIMGLRYFAPWTQQFTKPGFGVAVRWRCEGGGQVGYGPTPSSAYWQWRTDGKEWRGYAHES